MHYWPKLTQNINLRPQIFKEKNVWSGKYHENLPLSDFLANHKSKVASKLKSIFNYFSLNNSLIRKMLLKVPMLIFSKVRKFWIYFWQLTINKFFIRLCFFDVLFTLIPFCFLLHVGGGGGLYLWKGSNN